MKTIGILGGMGPMATVDLMKKIILSTEAGCDQEHIPILVDNNPQIPDRTAAIMGKGPSPVGEMLKSCLRLERGGADFIVIACNTAHYFLPEVLPQLSIPVLSIMAVTVAEARRQEMRTVGLLATSGTVRTRLYQQELEKQGIACIMPEEPRQHLIDDIIYAGVKAGRRDYDTAPIRQLLEDMKQRGAEAFILGCTEVPLAVAMYGLKGRFIDSTQELAKAAVKRAQG